jgi:hypothetical protein
MAEQMALFTRKQIEHTITCQHWCIACDHVLVGEHEQRPGKKPWRYCRHEPAEPGQFSRQPQIIAANLRNYWLCPDCCPEGWEKIKGWDPFDDDRRFGDDSASHA